MNIHVSPVVIGQQNLLMIMKRLTSISMMARIRTRTTKGRENNVACGVKSSFPLGILYLHKVDNLIHVLKLFLHHTMSSILLRYDFNPAALLLSIVMVLLRFAV